MRLRLAGLLTDSTKAQQWGTRCLLVLSEARCRGKECQELQEGPLGLALNLAMTCFLLWPDSVQEGLFLTLLLPQPAPSSLQDSRHGAIVGCHSLCCSGVALVCMQEPASSPALTLN